MPGVGAEGNGVAPVPKPGCLGDVLLEQIGDADQERRAGESHRTPVPTVDLSTISGGFHVRLNTARLAS